MSSSSLRLPDNILDPLRADNFHHSDNTPGRLLYCSEASGCTIAGQYYCCWPVFAAAAGSEASGFVVGSYRPDRCPRDGVVWTFLVASTGASKCCLCVAEADSPFQLHCELALALVACRMGHEGLEVGSAD